MRAMVLTGRSAKTPRQADACQSPLAHHSNTTPASKHETPNVICRGAAVPSLAMNLQSRGKRWLAAIEVAGAVTKRTLTSEAEFSSRGRPYPDQAHDAMIKGFFALRLTAEADPIPPESTLYTAIMGALIALDGLKIGAEFRESLEAFDTALDKALDLLREYTADDDSNIDEIISSLERAFTVSLLITLTSHTFVVDWDGKWQQHHQRFVNGHVAPDFGHYIEIKSGFLPLR